MPQIRSCILNTREEKANWQNTRPAGALCGYCTVCLSSLLSLSVSPRNSNRRFCFHRFGDSLRRSSPQMVLYHPPTVPLFLPHLRKRMGGWAGTNAAGLQSRPIPSTPLSPFNYYCDVVLPFHAVQRVSSCTRTLRERDNSQRILQIRDPRRREPKCL